MTRPEDVPPQEQDGGHSTHFDGSVTRDPARVAAIQAMYASARAEAISRRGRPLRPGDISSEKGREPALPFFRGTTLPDGTEVDYVRGVDYGRHAILDPADPLSLALLAARQHYRILADLHAPPAPASRLDEDLPVSSDALAVDGTPSGALLVLLRRSSAPSPVLRAGSVWICVCRATSPAHESVIVLRELDPTEDVNAVPYWPASVLNRVAARALEASATGRQPMAGELLLGGWPGQPLLGRAGAPESTSASDHSTPPNERDR